MKHFALVLFGLCTATLVSAQPCATPSGPVMLDISFDKSTYPGGQGPNVRQHAWKKAVDGRDALFDIQFYTVLAKDAPETLSPGSLEDAVQRLNAQFDKSGIAFRQAGPPIDMTNGALAYFQRSDENEQMLHHQKRSGRLIHVFVVDLIDGGGVRGYTYNPFTFKPHAIQEYKRNMIVLARQSLWGEDHSTFAHEMGHFFGLFHTHENHQGTNPSVPEGGDCAHTGDCICDTTADPDLTDLVDYNCRCKDLEGDIHLLRYQISIENIMSYAPPHCRSRFTEGQRHRMLQCAHLVRQDLIVGVVRDKGNAESYMIPITLSKAFEFNCMYGRICQAVIFVHNDGANFSRRMYHELSGMIDRNAKFQNVLPYGGGFTLVTYDTDRPDSFIPQFVGDVLFKQDGYNQQREFDWLLTMLQQRMAQYPALFVLRMKRVRETDFLMLDYIPGYMKPREIVELLESYQEVYPQVLGK